MTTRQLGQREVWRAQARRQLRRAGYWLGRWACAIVRVVHKILLVLWVLLPIGLGFTIGFLVALCVRWYWALREGFDSGARVVNG
jgi:hypothetical protein